jgi:hypothetical protein
MKAAYYHAPIATLLRADPDGILGELAAAHVVAAEHEEVEVPSERRKRQHRRAGFRTSRRGLAGPDCPPE